MAAEEDTIYVQPFEAELPTAANIGTSHDRALGSFQLPVSMEKKMLTTGCAHTGYHMKYCAFIRPAQNSANICEMSARKKEHSRDTYTFVTQPLGAKPCVAWIYYFRKTFTVPHV